MHHSSRKVAIAGAGAVGSTFAYALAQSGVAEEIVMVDKDAELARGQALDLAHGLPYFPKVDIRAGESDDYGDARVIVITAGSKQKSGESRLDLLKRNVSIMESVVDKITARNSDAVLVVVSNPVDILTYVAGKRTGWSKGRVMGSGTVLDSVRFRYTLSRHCDIDVHNVHAYILGEHGDSEFAAWSMTHMGGIPIDDYCQICGKCDDWQKERADMETRVRQSAYHIIDYKGATYFAVGLALVRLVGAILRDEKSVLTVSSNLSGEYGLNDVSLSLPAIVSSVGVERIMQASLPDSEMDALKHSAGILKDAISQLG
ncbi:MAG: L-lactate dehydrogenase [Dehalococcoidia bacterium]